MGSTEGKEGGFGRKEKKEFVTVSCGAALNFKKGGGGARATTGAKASSQTIELQPSRPSRSYTKRNSTTKFISQYSVHRGNPVLRFFCLFFVWFLVYFSKIINSIVSLWLSNCNILMKKLRIHTCIYDIVKLAVFALFVLLCVSNDICNQYSTEKLGWVWFIGKVCLKLRERHTRK